MIQINTRDDRPIYRRIKDSLRERIISGTLKPGEQLPTVRDMAHSMTINPNTIARSYRELELEGYIASIPGRGSFVAERDGVDDKRRALLLRELENIVNELEFLGIERQQQMDIILQGKRGGDA